MLEDISFFPLIEAADGFRALEQVKEYQNLILMDMAFMIMEWTYPVPE